MQGAVRLDRLCGSEDGEAGRGPFVSEGRAGRAVGEGRRRREEWVVRERRVDGVGGTRGGAGAVEVEEEGEEGGDEGVEDVEGWEGDYGWGVEGQGQGLEGEGDEGRAGFGGEDYDSLRIRSVRRDFDGKRGGRRVEQGRMHEAVLVAVTVPEQHAGFLLLSPADGFGLQVSAGFAVELVGDCYVGGVVEGHEAG